MFGICVKKRSRSGAPPILRLVRGDPTTRLELNRAHDPNKIGASNSSDEADLSIWFLFATAYRII